MIKVYLIIGLILMVVALALGAAKYSEAETKRKAEQAQFEAAMAQAKKTLEQTNASVAAQKEALAKSRAQISKLERTLRRHDLSHLAKAKPCLIAKRMTKATRLAYQNIASSTGTIIKEGQGKDPKVCNA